jgi:poly-beta-1,6-N-acetyl-D-glucosamine synthase
VSQPPLTYAVVTPVRDEEDNLPHLAESLVQQTVLPTAWVLVDNGSADRTLDIARELRTRYRWVDVLRPTDDTFARGGPIARAFQRGLEVLKPIPEVVVKLDADTSVAPDYFERLLRAFADQPRLGIASGTCYEYRRRAWRARPVTGTTVWGAARAYRWSCLRDLLPLEERMGWDGIDEGKANVGGWTTATLPDLPFRHHRREGERDGSRAASRLAQGRAAYYMGYRPWYLALRALHHARREPAALAMLLGFALAAATRQPRQSDAAARAYLRRQQSLRHVPRRAREALGRR